MSDPLYLHVLVYECPECNQPIAISHLNEERNLESVDGRKFRISCPACSSSAEVLAATAKSHSVQRWDAARAIPAIAGK